jgi:TRAP-type C4-dicarboxylate transport system permease small subunit
MAAADSGEHAARAVFFGLVAAALVVWGCWNLSADDYFQEILGTGYDRAIPAPVPR